MKKPKILIIGTADNVGGAAKQSWSLGQSLRKRGYQVRWLVRTKVSHEKYVHRFFNPIKTNLSHLRNFIFSTDIHWGISQEIFNHPWYKEADIIHLQNLHGNYFKLDSIIRISQEKKLVWTLHDLWALNGKSPYLLNSQKNKLIYPPMLFNTSKKLLEKKHKIYQQLSPISIVTPSLWLNKLTKKTPLKKHYFRTIYNGIDINIFKPNTNNIKKFPLIITIVISGGKKNTIKGWKLIKELIKVVKNDPDLELHLIGFDKNYQDQNIFYKSNLRSQKLIKQYQKSAAVLVPSLADNCPLVILEALACGIPVVATKVGGIPELIKHQQNGFLAKPTVNSLWQGIEWLKKLTSSQRQQIKKANRQLALKKYSLKIMTDQYEQLYQSLSS